MLNNIDKSNMYKLLDHWINNISPNYFDMSDLNLNRIGLFGYVNEIMAHNQESIMNENSVMYNELFFKRAVLPQSIYAYASHYQVDDIGASAAKMSFAIGINEEDLLKKAIKEGTETFFVIDAGTQIIVEGVKTYTIDYGIKISIKQDSYGENVYSAKYLTDGLDNPISSIKDKSNPYLKLTKITYSKTNYIFIYLEASQVDIIEKDKTIYSDDFIEYFSFDIECDTNEGEIADFSVFYKEPNSTEFIQIEKKLIDSAATENPFCYYQYKDHNKVNISFSTIARFFRPKFNSELKFIFYNTLGEQGNFEYTGDNVTVNLKSDKYDYRDIIVIGKSVSNSVGGRSRKTYEEIKNDVAINASTSNNIATEIDLNNRFKYIEGTNNIFFVKKRDDIIDRLYGAFLLLEDNEKNIVPSNTVDIMLTEKDFDLIDPNTKRSVVKAGAGFVYAPNERLLKRRDEYYDYELYEKDDYWYTNPFTIVVNKSPFYMEYYLNSIDTSFIPKYSHVNDSAIINFIVNKIEIKRNAIKENYYTITFRAIPNAERKDLKFANFDDKYKFISPNENVKACGILMDDDKNPTHSFNFNMIDSDYYTNECVFEALVHTDDYISIYGGLRMTENIFDLNDPTIPEPLIPASTLNIGVLMYVKNNFDEDIETAPMYYENTNFYENSNGYSITNEYTISEKVNFINNLNKLMYSDVQYDRDYRNNLNYIIKEVPVISYPYLYDNNYGTAFIKNFLSNYLSLKELLKFLTNSYNLSIKLYNTYGKSYYLYVNEDRTNTLDRVNIYIKCKIKLNPNKAMDEGLKTDIKNFIREYIDSVNNDDMNLYISNLIKSLENNFRDIIYINFEKMNNYSSTIQSIEKKFPGADLNEKNKLKEFVPEYLNINRSYYYDTNYDVNVAFV